MPGSWSSQGRKRRGEGRASSGMGLASPASEPVTFSPYSPPPPPPIEPYGDDDLWLEIERLPQDLDLGRLTLHGTEVDFFYQVLSKPDLAASLWDFGNYWINNGIPSIVMIPEVDLTAQPMKVFEALRGKHVVAIQATEDPAVEPGANGNPAAIRGVFTVARQDSAPNEPWNALVVRYEIGGFAQNGVDYASIQSSVTIQANEDTASIEVMPSFDVLPEFGENVVLTLLPGDGYVVNPQGYRAVVSISDREPGIVTVAEVPNPAGIAYHPVQGGLVVSGNWPNGSPWNFYLVKWTQQSGTTVSQWSPVSQVPDEVKFAIAQTSSGGFVAGEMFFGDGTVGHVGKVPPNGLNPVRPWSILTGATEIIRGGLHLDTTGMFGNDLVVVTSDNEGIESPKQIFRVSSNGQATLIAGIVTKHLEGVVTLPDDEQLYGPWAGKLITGDERSGVVFAVTPDSSVSSYSLGIRSEDVDLIPAGQSLYALDEDTGRILKIPSALFSGLAGWVLITESYEHNSLGYSRFHAVSWDTARQDFVIRTFWFSDFGILGHLEHVTFAPIELPALP